MANELDTIDLDNLDMSEVKRLKNQAVERLKAAGEAPLLQLSHQEGNHSTHTSHATHVNSPENQG